MVTNLLSFHVRNSCTTKMQSTVWDKNCFCCCFEVKHC